MAKRDLYYSYIDDLQNARDNPKELVDIVQGMANKLNRRFRRLEENDIGLNESAYYYAMTDKFSKETLNGNVRYPNTKSQLKQLNSKQLYELGQSLNKKLTSRTSTISGIKKLNEERINKGTQQLESDLSDIDFNIDKFKEFLRKGGGKILNNKYLDYTLVVEDFMDKIKNKVTVKQFIDTYNDFIDKHKDGPPDLSKLDKKFKKLIKSKEKKKGKKKVKANISVKKQSINVNKNKTSKVKKPKKATNVGKAYKSKK